MAETSGIAHLADTGQQITAGQRHVFVSEGGLGPRSWWYIPESGIYHQPELTQLKPCRAGISPARGGGSATRLRSLGV